MAGEERTSAAAAAQDMGQATAFEPEPKTTENTQAAETAELTGQATALDSERAPEAAHGHGRKGTGGIRRVRRAVLLACFLLIVVGLVANTGWGTLSSMGVGAIAAICPLGALETLVAEHTMVPRAVVVLMVVLVLVALFGRFFCSWLCPVPPVVGFFHPGKRKRAKEAAACAAAEDPATPAEGGAGGGGAAGIPASEYEAACAAGDELDAAVRASVEANIGHGCGSECGSCKLEPLGGERDGLHLDSRHGVLLGALASTAVFGFPVFCLICPVGLTIATVICVYRALCQQDPTLSLLVFPLILVVELVFFRKWCHKICPMGALMSLVGAKAPLAKPHVDEEACLRSQGVDCHGCVQACPELLDPHSKNLPECTKCGLCVDACPSHAVSLRIWPTKHAR